MRSAAGFTSALLTFSLPVYYTGLFYCTKCGRNQGDGCQQAQYNIESCGGCSGQNHARTFCSANPHVVPKTCWTWAMCFKLACERLAVGGGLFNPMCGNGICDDDESRDSCPFDCCPAVNGRCDHRNTTCPQECCGDPTCCEIDNTGNIGVKNRAGIVSVGMMLAGVLVAAPLS